MFWSWVDWSWLTNTKVTTFPPFLDHHMNIAIVLTQQTFIFVIMSSQIAKNCRSYDMKLLLAIRKKNELSKERNQTIDFLILKSLVRATKYRKRRKKEEFSFNFPLEWVDISLGGLTWFFFAFAYQNTCKMANNFSFTPKVKFSSVTRRYLDSTDFDGCSSSCNWNWKLRVTWNLEEFEISKVSLNFTRSVSKWNVEIFLRVSVKYFKEIIWFCCRGEGKLNYFNLRLT